RVEAHWSHTTVIAEGSVAGSLNEHGKFGKFWISSASSRIEDILGLFVTTARSPMSGKLIFRTTAEIPPTDQPFLKKVGMSGRFGIDSGSFSSQNTQGSIDKLSAGARGQNKEDPETVLTDLAGDFDLSRGTARF